MEKTRLIEQLKSELRQALKNIEEGKGIPLEEFDWGLPPHIIPEPQIKVTNGLKSHL